MKIRNLAFALFVCLSLSLIVSAHPGRTDSSGGHTNHTTGEYHFHHGYPEHQHYDFDGDGILDCPLNVEERNKSPKPHNATEPSRSESHNVEEENDTVGSVLELIVACIVFGIIGVSVIIFVLVLTKEAIERIRK